MQSSKPRMAIVDYGMGNLFSVARACEVAGIEPLIVADAHEFPNVDAIILPGVGAFGEAMATLRRLDLVSPLRDYALAGRPLFGVCLGMQLLMTLSTEFGEHEGLDLVPGIVRRLDSGINGSERMKVPQVGWNTIRPPAIAGDSGWSETPLDGLPPEEYVYFVHSYCAEPADPRVVVSMTSYEGVAFCSSLQSGSIFACQFHPERSGQAGLRVYRNFASIAVNQNQRSES